MILSDFPGGTFNIMSNVTIAMRNIGISAHIDSGKTTLTERILFYADKIHAIHEVKGKDGVGATMDSMDLERERGITIASASTNVSWREHSINIIDTPGHVDFTIEVERALRVLDGAIMVLCSVGGVQSQSITIDRQLKRYNIPRIAFVNKCDRTGANPLKVAKQLREKLGLNSVLIQLPIGLENDHEGVIDLVTMKAVYFDGKNGEVVRIDEIPENMKKDAQTHREEMLDSISMFCDELAEAVLEGTETVDQIKKAIRKGTLSLEMVPVMMGSAYRNKGIQTLLDGVIDFLPSPTEAENVALDIDNAEAQVKLVHDDNKPGVVLAFKLEDGQYGQLTYIRIYQGSVKKGDEYVNTRTRRKFKIGRLIRMHSNNMEDIQVARCGDIVALFGVECSTGDTFCSGGLSYSMISMHVPKPVISLAIKPKDNKSSDNMSKAINRFMKEDPTFRSFVDEESSQTIIQGMGELHCEIYIERMRREYSVDVEVGKPQVAYRETITRPVNFDYTHKKQTGGAGQYGRVAGIMEPWDEGEYEFIDLIKGGVIPMQYIPSCDKGFKACLDKGSLIGFPIVGVRITINDGSFHPVDSSDQAFQTAAIGAFRESYEKAKPEILEPIMKVAVEGPPEFQGNILASINQRRGIILTTAEDSVFARVDAEVPLSEMFGYSTALRSLTQGKAEFTMEFLKYAKVPNSISEQLKKDFAERSRR
jgi:elongation factor G